MTSPAVVVRPARRSDLDAILGLLEELRWERNRDGSTPTPGDAARTWESILGQDGRFVLVAEVAGEIVGTADLLTVANLTHELRPWAIVEHVVVANQARGRGIGSALLAAAVARAEAAGCYKVQLLSRKERSDAHRFYRAAGFEPTAEGFRRYFA
ncbi:MAG TPA: GNAT family N-acetyltransferase [Actinomycetota bacterium]